MLLHLSWSEMGGTRLLTASHLDLSHKKCLTFGLWRVTIPDPVNISETFSQRKFAAALQHLKPGKAPGPDSICSELILHAGAALKSWLRDFFLLAPTQNSQDLKKSACGRDSKTNKARGRRKKLSTDISALCPLQDPREAYLRPHRAIN